MIEVKNVVKTFDGFAALNDATPVSYTHLDVYKRQPSRWS